MVWRRQICCVVVCVAQMGYMSVEEHTPSLLRLRRSPGVRSWSLLVALVSVGLAAAYYSSDGLFWKSFYVAGCLFVALQNMEDWEEAAFDKDKNQIELKSSSLYTLVLTLWKKGHERVVLDLRQLCDVCVQEETVRYLGKGYLLMLKLEAGFSYPLTQSATLAGPGDVEAVGVLLKRFLKLEELQRHRQQDYDDDEEEEEDSVNLTDSDDEAEQL
uniref:Essential for reactive oxygen species protein n=2 Tax=Oryzias latipes TaxID=8090 RepID=A0A3B3HW35_ORYLA